MEAERDLEISTYGKVLMRRGFPRVEPDAREIYAEDDVPAFNRAAARAATTLAEEAEHDYWLRKSSGRYSATPANTRVVALDKEKYTREQAVERFAELQEKQGLRVWGQPFHTGRYFCWRVYS